MFENKKPNPVEVLICSKGYVKEFCEANMLTFSNLPSTSTGVSNVGKRSNKVRWRPPRDNKVKFNSGAQFNLSTGRGYNEIVVEIKKGSFLPVLHRRYMLRLRWWLKLLH